MSTKAMNVLGQKIKQLRLSKGWTLDELVAHMGCVITKQAISKYEQSSSVPSAKNLAKLAKVFNVKIVDLLSPPKYDINFVAYRKKSSLRIKDQSRIQSLIKEELTDRLRIQELVRPNERPNVPIQSFRINNLLEAEDVADKIRIMWELGKKEIASITNVLESNLIHVMSIDAHSDFDGISVIAKSENEVRGVGVVARKGLCGERQKLNLAHELGHLVLKPTEGLDEEKAAFRFGAAFLAPKEWIIAEVGTKRTSLDAEELFILKKKSGLSVAALLYRLKDLEIISDSYCRGCFKTISGWGWRKEEPHSLPSEVNEWLEQNARKALSEGLISPSEAEKFIGERIDTKISLSLQKVRSIMNLSLEERRKVLADEAEKISEFYKQSDDLWQSGDFIE